MQFLKMAPLRFYLGRILGFGGKQGKPAKRRRGIDRTLVDPQGPAFF
jgi:hypothetical protein